MMPRKGDLGGRPRQDSEFLAAALIGYQQRRAEIDGKIAELRQQLGGLWPSVPAGKSDGTHRAGKRIMSAAGRKRIAEAQRKRWKAFHQAQEPAAAKKAAPAARRMSAAGRKRIAEAQRKRWKVFHQAQEPAAAKKAAPAARRMSAAGRKRIAEATKKRWAAFRNAKKAQAG